MSKKRTGLFVGLGCGLLLCLPICAGVVGAGGWFVMANGDEIASFDPNELMEMIPKDLMPVETEPATEVSTLPTPEVEAVADAQEEADEEEDDLLDSGLEDEVAELEEPEPENAEARIVIEDDGQASVTNTRPAAKPVGQPKKGPPTTGVVSGKPKPAPEPEPMPFEEDEEDFDDIAAEIAELDALAAPEPTTKKSEANDKPGTIKVSGDVDRASVIGSDGVYRSPGKHDPGVYRVEITLDDGKVLTERVNLGGGETVKLKCSVDDGGCTR